MKRMIKVLSMVILLSQNVFALNADYLADYSCDEFNYQQNEQFYFLQSAKIKLDKPACILGFLNAYAQNKEELNSYSAKQQAQIEYPITKVDEGIMFINLQKSYVAGYELVMNLVNYNPCSKEHFCSAQTKDAQRKIMFSIEDKQKACSEGFEFAVDQDIMGYRDFVDVLNEKTSSLKNRTNTISFFDGATQAYRCGVNNE